MNFENSSINNSGFQVGCLWIRITDSDSNPQLFVLPVEDPILRRLQHTLLHNKKFQFTIIHFLSQIPIYFYIFTPQYRFTAFGLIQPKSSIKYKCNARSPMEKRHCIRTWHWKVNSFWRGATEIVMSSYLYIPLCILSMWILFRFVPLPYIFPLFLF